jgi:hypothetical protein
MGTANALRGGQSRPFFVHGRFVAFGEQFIHQRCSGFQVLARPLNAVLLLANPKFSLVDPS